MRLSPGPRRLPPVRAKDWRGAALADALAARTLALDTQLGTQSFLRGWFAWLETQCGLETPPPAGVKAEALANTTASAAAPMQACVGAYGRFRR